MPQMSPMWWTMIMILFMITYMMIMSINYFNFMKKNINQQKMKKKMMNWKW